MSIKITFVLSENFCGQRFFHCTLMKKSTSRGDEVEPKNVYKVVLITTLQGQYLKSLLAVTICLNFARMLINHSHTHLSLFSSLDLRV